MAKQDKTLTTTVTIDSNADEFAEQLRDVRDAADEAKASINQFHLALAAMRDGVVVEPDDDLDTAIDEIDSFVR